MLLPKARNLGYNKTNRFEKTVGFQAFRRGIKTKNTGNPSFYEELPVLYIKSIPYALPYRAKGQNRYVIVSSSWLRLLLTFTPFA